MLKVKQYTSILLKGKTDYTCPGCGMPNSFFLRQDNICEFCMEILPDIRALIDNAAARTFWHFYHPVE